MSSALPQRTRMLILKRLSSRFSAMDSLVVEQVQNSWDRVRAASPDDYKERVGGFLFKKLIEESPSTLEMFQGDDPDSRITTPEEFYQSPTFNKVSVSAVSMIEMAIQLVGPELDLVTEKLWEVGAKHSRYGVTRRQYVIFGSGIAAGIEEVLGEPLSDDVRESWRIFYTYLTLNMQKGDERARMEDEMKLKAEAKKKRASLERKKQRRGSGVKKPESCPTFSVTSERTEASSLYDSSRGKPPLPRDYSPTSKKTSRKIPVVGRVIGGVRTILTRVPSFRSEKSK